MNIYIDILIYIYTYIYIGIRTSTVPSTRYNPIQYVQYLVLNTTCCLRLFLDSCSGARCRCLNLVCLNNEHETSNQITLVEMEQERLEALCSNVVSRQRATVQYSTVQYSTLQLVPHGQTYHTKHIAMAC